MRAWFKTGTPWIWLNAGAIALCLVMVIGVLSLIAVQGGSHFWPADLQTVQLKKAEGEPQTLLAELVRTEEVSAVVLRESGLTLDSKAEYLQRHLLKVGNRDIYGRDFAWYLADDLSGWTVDNNATVIERREWGNFYGFPQQLLEADKVVAEGAAVWPELVKRIARANAIFEQISDIEKGDIGRINKGLEQLRLNERRLEIDGADKAAIEAYRAQSAADRAALDAEYAELQKQLEQLYAEAKRDTLVATSAEGKELKISLGNIVHAHQPNAMSLLDKSVHYVGAVWSFLTEDPREANTEGGIFPAIFGTITMVILMSIIVTPFGVLAAIYLREYAKDGPLLRIIRISVYNLAGVPSIVYGVFGLGFFVYILGGNIDQLFYAESLPSPTFGTPGLFWASLTLALLTLPVVIVSTEEGLSRIPSTIRMGSLALGATKSETLWKVVVPLATPAMMTGLILSIARAAGEVAPLMLVGVVKLAPTLPVDGNFPFVHLDQKIMHLGFHVYDVGFQSPNVEASRPLLYATALVLVLLIVVLNMAAIHLRNKLREKYRSESD
ncbi:phosphate ABC transporter permease PstA [Rheinheimera sp.]|uniref:phosphate ABC transporter permease PstA n=1 Tax=Rheinheimera sp. TaxID=1869214 RepID=UPI0027BA94D1|nr:phosphate ABC transporter permease PstA [Rheinheimera sp.]